MAKVEVKIVTVHLDTTARPCSVCGHPTPWVSGIRPLCEVCCQIANLEAVLEEVHSGNHRNNHSR